MEANDHVGVPSSMASARSTELTFSSARVVHIVMPPHKPGGYTSTSEPLAIGVSFTGHDGAVVEDGLGRPSELSFPAGTCGINGLQPTRWLRVREASEAVEIEASPEELASAAEELRIDWHNRPDLLQPGQDPVIWGVCARFRRVALGATTIEELESESLIRGLLAHVAIRYLHADPRRYPRGRLDRDRLSRVTDLVESTLPRPPSLRDMADVAALSPFHFQRAFQATTGLSPHAYVMARRMERARRLLARPGMRVADVAARLGFSDLSHFRRSFRRQFNATPGTLRGALRAELPVDGVSVAEEAPGGTVVR